MTARSATRSIPVTTGGEISDPFRCTFIPSAPAATARRVAGCAGPPSSFAIFRLCPNCLPRCRFPTRHGDFRTSRAAGSDPVGRERHEVPGDFVDPPESARPASCETMVSGVSTAAHYGLFRDTHISYTITDVLLGVFRENHGKTTYRDPNIHRCLKDSAKKPPGLPVFI